MRTPRHWSTQVRKRLSERASGPGVFVARHEHADAPYPVGLLTQWLGFLPRRYRKYPVCGPTGAEPEACRSRQVRSYLRKDRGMMMEGHLSVATIAALSKILRTCRIATRHRPRADAGGNRRETPYAARNDPQVTRRAAPPNPTLSECPSPACTAPAYHRRLPQIVAHETQTPAKKQFTVAASSLSSRSGAQCPQRGRTND
jgi:hypothetical protein